SSASGAGESGGAGGRGPLGADVRAGAALARPPGSERLLITTIPALSAAAGEGPPMCTAGAAPGSRSLCATPDKDLYQVHNCYIDRDIDQEMRRTRRRAVAMHQVTPRGAMIYGLVLAALSTVGFALFVNWLSAALSLFAILFYIFVYTMLLKRRTAQNVVWG